MDTHHIAIEQLVTISVKPHSVRTVLAPLRNVACITSVVHTCCTCASECKDLTLYVYESMCMH